MDWSLALYMSAMLVLGAALGFFGGVFGIGGGIVAVPLFIVAFGMDQALAQGTALVLMTPNLLIGWWRYNKHHKVPLAASIAIAASATLTTWASARYAVQLDQNLLHWIFNVFLLLAGIRLFLLKRKRSELEDNAPEPRPALMPLVGVLGGTSMGLLGMGGGLVATPVLASVLRHRQTVAQSLSLALVAPSSAVALFTYASADRVDWQLGLPLAIGGLFTVSAGVALAHHLPEKTLRRGFASMLVLASLALMIHSLCA